MDTIIDTRKPFNFFNLRPEKVNNHWNVFYSNGIFLGQICAKEDGFYDFWPEFPSKGGCWPAHLLHEIANYLDYLNEPWKKQIERDVF